MQISKSDRLGKEPIVPLLFKLSIPSIIAMATQAMYNIVDSIYIAQISEDALTAVGLAFPLQMILIAIAVGTGVGTSSYISRQLGKGNKERASNAAEHVILSVFIYGFLIALIGYFFSEELISFFIKDPEIIAMGAEYINIIFIGSMALFIPMIGNNILRGEGNTFYPMIIMLIGSVLNIILDPFFIFGIGFFPKLGIGGAAIATVFSRIISGSILLLLLFSDKNEISLNLKNFEFDFSIIKDVYRVGLPAMIMQLLASLMMSFINFLLGDTHKTAIAVMTVYFRLQSFVFMPVFGLNQGYMPLMGYNYGHGKPERMKKTIKTAFFIAFAFTITGFIVFQIFPEQLLGLFGENPTPEFINLGVIAFKKISLAFPIIGLSIIISTTFQAIGKGWPSLALSMLRQLGILIPLFYIFLRYAGINTVWYAFPISELTAFIFGGLWLRSHLKTTFQRLAEA